MSSLTNKIMMGTRLPKVVVAVVAIFITTMYSNAWQIETGPRRTVPR